MYNPALDLGTRCIACDVPREDNLMAVEKDCAGDGKWHVHWTGRRLEASTTYQGMVSADGGITGAGALPAPHPLNLKMTESNLIESTPTL